MQAIEVWARTRARYLSKWLAADPSGNRVDAISSATLSSHKTHTSTWNLTDVNGNKVPDGDYTVYIEVTDQETKPGAWTSITFTKGPDPQTVTPPDEQYYKGVMLVYQ